MGACQLSDIGNWTVAHTAAVTFHSILLRVAELSFQSSEDNFPFLLQICGHCFGFLFPRCQTTANFPLRLISEFTLNPASCDCMEKQYYSFTTMVQHWALSVCDCVHACVFVCMQASVLVWFCAFECNVLCIKDCKHTIWQKEGNANWAKSDSSPDSFRTVNSDITLLVSPTAPSSIPQERLMVLNKPFCDSAYLQQRCIFTLFAGTIWYYGVMVYPHQKVVSLKNFD